MLTISSMKADDINLPTDIMNQIFGYLGYPIVTEDDLEASIDFIKEVCIWPAFHQYFTYFPLENHEYHTVSTEFSFDFPNENTFGVLDSRLHPGFGFHGSSHSSNPFVAEKYTRVDNQFGYSPGLYGTRNDYGHNDVYPILRAAKKARRSNRKRFRVNVDERNRKVTGYTNMHGQLEITWAEYSTDWEDVRFVHQNDVISLSAAEALLYFGRLRGQESTDMPVEFDSTEFIDTGTQMKEDILERWRASSKITLIRK